MLRGHLDRATRQDVIGWACDEAHPNRPVALLILDNGELLDRVLADQPRPDLAERGLGDGQCGFALHLPQGLNALTRHVIHVLRESDGAELDNSPVLIEPAGAFDAEVAASVAALLNAAEGEAEITGRIAFLTGQMRTLSQKLADLRSRRAQRTARQRRFRSGAGGGEDKLPPRALIVADRAADAAAEPLAARIAALRRLGFEVSLAPADMRPPAEPLGHVTCYAAPAFASVEEVLRRDEGGFDLIHLDRLTNAARYAALARAHGGTARLWFGADELRHRRLAYQGAAEQRPELVAFSRRTRLAEFFAAWSVDAVVTSSAATAAVLRRDAPGALVHLLPRGVEPRPPRRAFARRRGVVFLADPEAPEDADAAGVLLREVMPRVWQANPDIPCLIAGTRAGDDLSAIGRPVVRVPPGEDRFRLLQRVRATVLPPGARPDGRLVASLAAGIPCLATPEAADGAGLPAALAPCLADDAAGLAAAILRVHDDAEANADLARAGLAHVAAHHAPAHLDAALRAVLGLFETAPASAALVG